MTPSTVPGAVAALQTIMQQVAYENPAMNVGVTVGVPVAEVANNYMMVGHYQTGELIAGYTLDWRTLGVQVAGYMTEQYALIGSLRTWQGDSDEITALTNAFVLLNGVMSGVAGDLNAGGALTPSGAWKMSNIATPSSGPLPGQGGWAVVVTFDVDVREVRLAVP